MQEPRRVIALVRADLFDREAFDHRKRVEGARRLAKKLHSRRAPAMSEAERNEASEAVAWLRRTEG